MAKHNNDIDAPSHRALLRCNYTAALLGIVLSDERDPDQAV